MQGAPATVGNSSGERPGLVVGVTGASGVIYAVRLLRALGELEIPSHLVMTEWAEKTLRVETDLRPQDVRAMATRSHGINNQAAPIASGSCITRGMAIVPCSVNTVAGLAHGRSDNLLLRAADVTLKEGRPLVAAVRETPLSRTHLRNLLLCAETGTTVMPPMPAFYTAPMSVEDLVDQFVGRVLDQFDFDHAIGRRWRESPPSEDGAATTGSG